jgi:DNA mismatch repair protein MutL
VGIPRDELPVALRRHATSKITNLHELESVATMGFRGEALAAIGSVSEMSLLSRPPTKTPAPSCSTPAAASCARRARHRHHGGGERAVLFHPGAPQVLENRRHRAGPLHRIRAPPRAGAARCGLCHLARGQAGGAVARHLRAQGDANRRTRWRAAWPTCWARTSWRNRWPWPHKGPVTVTGRAGLPDAARSRADQQYCYVNGRFVRDKVLTHAARSAYEDVLHGHKQPVYALYVEIDPARVDVNVHPTKIEVRFRDSREVHQAVRHAVENALAAPRAAALAAGTAAAPETATAPGGADDFKPKQPLAHMWQTQAAIKFEERGHHVADLQALWGPRKETVPAGNAGVAFINPGPVAPGTGPGAASGTAQPAYRAPTVADAAGSAGRDSDEATWPLGRAVAQLHGVYILAENAKGLVVVDMHAAHERIVYERLKAQVDSGARIASQPLLIPATFAATPEEVATAEASAEVLATLGLEVVPFSPKTWPCAPCPPRWPQRQGLATRWSWPAACWPSWPPTTPAPWCSARAMTSWAPWPATAPCGPTASSPSTR